MGSVILTEKQLLQIMPHIPHVEKWCESLNKVLPDYDINTNLRVAGFLAQCACESSEFRAIEENLNYNSEELRKVFRKYFPSQTIAEQYAHNRNLIANRVCANRMGNGDEASGDGWEFRGRGLIQLTGKSNYQKFGETVGLTAEQVTAYLATEDGAVHSACWFWEERHINEPADRRDIKEMTRLVNGGLNGLEDRTRYYELALRVL